MGRLRNIIVALMAVVVTVGLTVNFIGCSKDNSMPTAPFSDGKSNPPTPLAKSIGRGVDQASTEGKSDQPANDYQWWYKEQLIDAEQGGWIQCNKTRLVIPPRALRRDTWISILIEDKPVEGLPSAIKRNYTFGPSGTRFKKAVMLELSYQGADLNGWTEADLQIYYYEEESGTWEPMGGTVNTSNNKVIFNGLLDHFSRYAVAHSQ